MASPPPAASSGGSFPVMGQSFALGCSCGPRRGVGIRKWEGTCCRCCLVNATTHTWSQRTAHSPAPSLEPRYCVLTTPTAYCSLRRSATLWMFYCQTTCPES
ncbi:hypothetical protein J4Q44_G00237990 [Coregonus suidteri]|uniref:Uncharacterized protein n=1 Tax=Coregonus suidteri TaxID=861788 RepID=A0AAN8L125_9TELE